MLNKVTLIGNLGRDPEVSCMPSGDSVANLALATSETWKDKQTGEKKEKTEWHRVVFFGKPAEILQQYAQKGTRLYIEGSLQTRKWEKDGIDRYTTEIKGREFKFLGGGIGQDQAGQRQGATNPAPAAPATTPTQHAQEIAEFFDDDIPFNSEAA